MLYRIFLDLLQFGMKEGHLFAKFENPEKKVCKICKWEDPI